MALLSQLVGVLAQVTGDPEPGMVVLARSLREAGYITTGGRGRSKIEAKVQPHGMTDHFAWKAVSLKR